MAPSQQRSRLDVELVARGLAENRSQAKGMIMAGDIRVAGEVTSHAGQRVSPESPIEVTRKRQFVGRGGEKLVHALLAFDIDAEGAVCCDIGSSTGGFTDCLLQAGAATVYAIDVGYGQLDYKLRIDPRVVVMERTNARYLEQLPEPVSIATIDVSFISLKHILPVARTLLTNGGTCVALIKPQFEAGRDEVGKGGVVRDAAVHRRVIGDVASYSTGFAIEGLDRSPITGPAGNVEFLACFTKTGTGTAPEQFDERAIDFALTEADT